MPSFGSDTTRIPTSDRSPILGTRTGTGHQSIDLCPGNSYPGRNSYEGQQDSLKIAKISLAPSKTQ
eukprot:152975-Rhodomonas_salina.1